MQWSEVVKPPKSKLLRQFAGLCLVFFLALAALAVWKGQSTLRIGILAALGLGIGGLGLIKPEAIRLVYTGWMIAAFPIGWTLSRVLMGFMFYVVFTPVALVFRLIGRDTLHLKRRAAGTSNWSAKPGTADVNEYFRQF